MRLLGESWSHRGGNSLTKLELLLLSCTIAHNRRRIKSHRLVGVAMPGQWTKQSLVGILDGLATGWTELMVHPGSTDGLEGQPTRLVRSRAEELGILVDSEVNDRCRCNTIALASCRRLAARA